MEQDKTGIYRFVPKFVSTKSSPKDEIPSLESYENENNVFNKNIERPKKTVIPMSRSNEKEGGRNDDRLKRFMSSYSNKYQPSEGKITPTGVVVESIQDRFKSVEPTHLMKLRPPASSTPTTDELTESWVALNNRQEMTQQFFSDPVVNFFLMLDGIIDNNTILKKTSEAKQNFSVSDIYQMLAGSSVSSNRIPAMGRTNIRALQAAPGGTAGLSNVGAAFQPNKSVRVGNDSVDDETMRAVRLNELTPVKKKIQRSFYGTEDPDFTPIDRRTSFGSDYSDRSFGGPFTPGPPSRPIFSTPRTPRVSFSPSSAQTKGDWYEPSGPQAQGSRPERGEGEEASRLERAEHIPISLGDEEEVAQMVHQEEEDRTVLERRITSGVRPDTVNKPPQSRNERLYEMSKESDKIPAVAKHLSDLRAVAAYDWMNSPEITGTLPLSTSVISAVKVAFNRLKRAFPHNFKGAELMDFITDEYINVDFAEYAALLKLYNTSRGMNKVVLEKTQPRLLSERKAMESSVFSHIYWNNSQKRFEDESERDSNASYYRPSSKRNFDKLYYGSNEMFHY